MNDTLDKKISFPVLLRFAMPTIISMVFMSIYTVVDGVFVSRLIGTNALSAVNIIIPIIATGVALATMFGTGGNAICARLLGEGKGTLARKCFTLFVLAFVCFILLLSLVGLVFMEPLLKFLGASELLMNDCRTYAFWILVFLPFTMAGCMFQTFHITNGKAMLGLILSVIGGVTNIILDYIFMGIMDMGIAGGAIATSTGYVISTVVGTILFLKNRNLSLHFEKPVWSFRRLIQCCTNGSSEMVSNISVSIVIIMFNNILIRLAGEDGVASLTILLYTQGLFGAVLMGYSIGVAPLISYNYGKGNDKNQKSIFRCSFWLIGVVSIIMTVFSILCAVPLVKIFAGHNENVMQMAVRGFRIFAFSFLFSGASIYASNMFTALGNGLISAMISLLRTLVFVVGAILLLSKIFGIDGVWTSVPVAEFLGFIVTAFCVIRYKNIYYY